MTTLAVATQLGLFSTKVIGYSGTMAFALAPIRRRLVFAPIGVCAVCTFLTLTTTARYGLALSSPGPRRLFNSGTTGRKVIELSSSQYDNTGGDSYGGGNDRGQRRSRSSREPGNNDAEFYGRGDGRRRRSDSGSRVRRDFDDNDYDNYEGGNTRRHRDGNSNDNYNEKGRNRYSSDGRKKQRPPGGRSGRGGRGRGRGRGNFREQQDQPERPRPPTPPLDSRPTYFTCRHTYESCLRLELQRSLATAEPPIDEKGVSFQRPHPGLVLASTDDEATASFLSGLRPTYALQAMPDCVVVEAESIKGLAREVVDKLLSTPTESGEASGLLRSELVSAPKGSLAIHSLVPEMGRGMPESQLPQYRRITKIGEEIAGQLKKRCRAARAANNDNDEDGIDAIQKEQWLLQIILLEPQIVAASFAKCAQNDCKEEGEELPSTATTTTPLPNWRWPNWDLPAGLALVDIEEEQRNSPIRIPSSAYRKLLEAFWYMGERPPQGSEFQVVDLGACPGGWTGALRLMGCRVLAVDRSPLDATLMRDTAGVEYYQGDAFRFVPPWARDGNGDASSWPGLALEQPFPNTWMVSDIIAYPDKITELLDDWCGKHWVSHAIVTIKFQSEIPWEDVDAATKLVEGHGYSCRTVHFFNNKNEVTFSVQGGKGRQ